MTQKPCGIKQATKSDDNYHKRYKDGRTEMHPRLPCSTLRAQMTILEENWPWIKSVRYGTLRPLTMCLLPFVLAPPGSG